MSEKPFNIFDEASRTLAKTKQPTPTPSNAAPPPRASPPIPRRDPPVKLPKPDLSDVQHMIDEMRHIHDEIDRKLDEALKKTGWSMKDIKNYLNNPNNYQQKDDWNRFQSKRKNLLGAIWEKLGKEEPQKSFENIQKQEAEKEAKRGKSKMLGARRNWIPIR